MSHKARQAPPHKNQGASDSRNALAVRLPSFESELATAIDEDLDLQAEAKAAFLARLLAIINETNPDEAAETKAAPIARLQG
jgi:hypothetical protein